LYEPTSLTPAPPYLKAKKPCAAMHLQLLYERVEKGFERFAQSGEQTIIKCR
jgi:hypothetical protein